MWILPKQLHTSAFVPDTAALSLDSNESSQLCAQSLFVRSKPSPARTWLQKWKRDSWTRHLSGRILRPSHGTAFVTAWTSSLEVIPASRSPQPGSALAQKTQDICGHTSQTAFGFFDPESASLKTSKDTSVLACEKSLESWKSLVTQRRGEYSQRLKQGLLIRENECLSVPWPTPSQRDYKGACASRVTSDGYNSRLDEAVIVFGLPAPANHSTHGSRPESWATPQAMDGNMTNNPRTDGRQEQLPNQVQSWATPKASDPQHSGPNMRDSAGNYALPAQAVRESWATPQTRDNRSGGAERWDDPNRSKNLNDQIAATTTQNAKLNSRWVETLMGLPVGWCMPSCASPATIAQTSCDF